MEDRYKIWICHWRLTFVFFQLAGHLKSLCYEKKKWFPVPTNLFWKILPSLLPSTVIHLDQTLKQIPVNMNISNENVSLCLCCSNARTTRANWAQTCWTSSRATRWWTARCRRSAGSRSSSRRASSSASRRSLSTGMCSPLTADTTTYCTSAQVTTTRPSLSQILGWNARTVLFLGL